MIDQRSEILGLDAATMRKIGAEIAAEARQSAFEAGRPVTYTLDGQTVREYADGRIEPVDESNAVAAK
ncbi:MAG: hypothetical protein ACFB22_01430 [Rhodothalassiaceae bacterium]